MRFCILVSAFCLLTSAASAVQPGFDPKDVVRQVRSANSNPLTLALSDRGRSGQPSNPVLDDGEFLIDTSATLGPAPYHQGEPAIAFDGANFLVAWTDGRSGFLSDIYGARVTPGGHGAGPLGHRYRSRSGRARGCL